MHYISENSLFTDTVSFTAKPLAFEEAMDLS